MRRANSEPCPPSGWTEEHIERALDVVVAKLGTKVNSAARTLAFKAMTRELDRNRLRAKTMTGLINVAKWRLLTAIRRERSSFVRYANSKLASMAKVPNPLEEASIHQLSETLGELLRELDGQSYEIVYFHVLHKMKFEAIVAELGMEATPANIRRISRMYDKAISHLEARLAMKADEHQKVDLELSRRLESRQDKSKKPR